MVQRSHLWTRKLLFILQGNPFFSCNRFVNLGNNDCKCLLLLRCTWNALSIMASLLMDCQKYFENCDFTSPIRSVMLCFWEETASRWIKGYISGWQVGGIFMKLEFKEFGQRLFFKHIQDSIWAFSDCFDTALYIMALVCICMGEGGGCCYPFQFILSIYKIVKQMLWKHISGM